MIINKNTLAWQLVVLLLIQSSSCKNLLTIRTKKPEGEKAEGLKVLPQKTINPHWTGKDCEVCHRERPEPGQKDLTLKFGGDYVAICNSCHQSEEVPGDLHPVGMISRGKENLTIPEWLPLQDEKLTCITCHDVKLPIEDNPPLRFLNPDFLRGGPYKNKVELCFYCHREKAYQEINPHQQLNKQGGIIAETCLYCHQALPDPTAALTIEKVTFRSQAGTFCSACHSEEKDHHPAWANHNSSPSHDMLQNIQVSEKRFKVTLPLFEGSVFCSTCHNPHERGVLNQPEASKGSAENHRLRLNGDYELCIACHAEKRGLLSKKVSIEIKEGDWELSEPMGKTITHTANREQECKACHKITREHPNRPSTYKLCFQAECHIPDAIIGGDFVHDLAFQGKCLFCHASHESRYDGLLIEDQQKLCTACHPLIQSEKRETKKQKGKDLHDYYLSMFRKVVPHQEPTCASCHGIEHSKKISERGLEPCYLCHIYIKKLLEGRKGKQVNFHDTFSKKRCTDCHNPHSSVYPYLLKERSEMYAKRR